MRYRQLGKTGLHVSEIGFGAWGIGGSQWLGATDAESMAALELAIAGGVNLIDTALAYGNGHSEKLVGAAVRAAQADVCVATKVPPKNGLWPARPGVDIDAVFPREYIMDTAGRSLQNLGLERIGILQLHVWNPEWLDRDDWKRAFEELKTSGKVAAVGVSINDHEPDSALELIRTGLIDTVQVIYNIFDQSPEENLFPLCQERNIGVLARVPLDEGSLAGAVNEDTEFHPEDFRSRYFGGDRKQQVVERLTALMDDLRLETPEALPEIALRFCLSHRAVSSVIPGMRTTRSVAANIGIPGRGPLPQHTLDILRLHAWERNFYNYL
jgi:aryl-alcohol dehydrogenase-like predicted oxidoreductase